MSETSSTTSTTAMPPPPPELSFRLQSDSRQVLTRKRAAQLLAPLSEGRYTSITLGGCALGDAAAGVAGPILVKLANRHCVRSVTFADCIASLAQEEALRTLSALAASMGIWKHLRSVDLSHNALGSMGVAACAPLLQKQCDLEELRLVESGLATESARLLEGYLCPGPVTNLRVLDIHANRLESPGTVHLAVVVAKSPRLERLRLSSLGALPNALIKVAEALAGKTMLKELDLSDNMLDADAAEKLAVALRQLPALERLRLCDLDMGDEACSHVLKALVNVPSPVRELALAGNELSPASVPALRTFVFSRLTELRHLDLGRNSLGADIALGLAELLKAAQGENKRIALTHVLLSSNECPTLPLLQLALRLVPLPTLECFDISGNGVSETVVDKLATALGSSVVVFDSPDAGESASATEDNETQLNNGDGEVESALEELSNAPCAITRDSSPPLVEDSPTSPTPPSPAASSPAAASPAASSQSRSAVSRLVSIFSRSTNDRGSASALSAPSTQVANVEESSPIQEDDEHRAEAESGVSYEDDSGRLPESGDAAAVALEGRGATVTSSSTTSTRDVPETPTAFTPSTPVGNASTANPSVIQSARKLKESIASLSKEISDVAGELQIPVASPALRRGMATRSSAPGGEATEGVNDFLLGGGLRQERLKQARLVVLLDILGGLLVTLFVVVVVLAIAQSQEESTFSYRLV